MMDIFDTKIVCRRCNKQMKPIVVNEGGLQLRAVKCSGCKERIIHPSDLKDLEKFNSLKGKTYNVKLRLVGNSHAVSIPKEIVNFMHEQQRQMRTEMNYMVKLCFEDFRRLSLVFGEDLR